MKYHVSVVPRQLYFPSGQYFPQCCALRENIIPWENITLLAVHRNVIFHDHHGQYLYNIIPPHTRRAKKKKLLCCPLPTDRKMRKNRVVFFFFLFFFFFSFFFFYVRFGRTWVFFFFFFFLCQIWANFLKRWIFVASHLSYYHHQRLQFLLVACLNLFIYMYMYASSPSFCYATPVICYC